MKQHDIQLDTDGNLRHFLTIEGLKKQMLLDILDNAENFSSVGHQQVKKVPLLRGKTIANLFLKQAHEHVLPLNSQQNVYLQMF